VALFTNDLRAVPAALLLARAAGANIWQNIAFSVITKVGCAGLHIPAPKTRCSAPRIRRRHCSW
jgi:cation transport ATPase